MSPVTGPTLSASTPTGKSMTLHTVSQILRSRRGSRPLRRVFKHVETMSVSMATSHRSGGDLDETATFSFAHFSETQKYREGGRRKERECGVYKCRKPTIDRHRVE